MKNNFSPSINILRDQEKEFAYIPTSNAERVIEQLNKNVLSGIKSFYLVGSFGTGKSSFLLAFEKQVSKGNKIFSTPITFNGKTKYEIFNIVGDFRSFEDSLREELNISGKKNIIQEFDNYYKRIHTSKKGLLIAIDEFGKFLEYASQNNPEKELYIIQKLAEFANDYKKNILFLTTLHQGFDVYRSRLDEKTKNEWDKVKGRLKEITFNEPVEQLLHLAAKYLNGKAEGISNRDFISLYCAILASRVYPLNNALDEKLAQNLFPLDLLSAGILTKSFQKYGQNERSLFTFLETNHYSNFISSGSVYFNLNSLYEYLIENFYSLLSSKYNPDFLKWSVIRNSLERSDILFERYSEPKEKLIKTIGLLNIFAPAGAYINKKFLNEYGKLALGIHNVSEELRALETKKIIRYQDYSDTYVLFEGTDIDIDLALNEAENYINQEPDLVNKLMEYFSFPYIPAKASYIKKGTPRFFEFVISDKLVITQPQGEVDGIINLIFDTTIDLKKTKALLKESGEAILFAVYNNTNKIKATLTEIDKVNYVLENNTEDRVVQRELKNFKDSLISEINQLVIEGLFEDKTNITWFYRGEEQIIKSRSKFNKLLSKIIDEVYTHTPIFRNELINREKLPGAITIARKLLLKNLMFNWNKEDLDFDDKKFPPEKTIYLSLLKSTGIHRLENKEYVLGEPKEKSFKALWNTCEEFFESAKHSKKSLLELTESLSNRPYKLKQGFLDFWLPIYLIIKRDDYALFNEDVYIPQLSDDLFNLVIRYPESYYIKAFDIQGIKFDLFNRYRRLINKSIEEKVTNQTFIDTIRPFLTFYRSLPEYSKKTNRLSREALSLKSAIANSKDPEKTFFEDFPVALGYTSKKLYDSEKELEAFTQKLQECIREIRTSFDELVNRIETRIVEELKLEQKDFLSYKKHLIQRYASIKKYLLLPHQKAFYLRMTSELDDRISWLSSIANSLIGKNLESINDDEEEILGSKLTDIFKEFDNLTNFANLEVNEAKEEAILFEITPINDTPIKKVVRVPKQKTAELKRLEEDIRQRLTKSRSVNQLVLLKLLKEQLDNE